MSIDAILDIIDAILVYVDWKSKDEIFYHLTKTVRGELFK